VLAALVGAGQVLAGAPDGQAAAAPQGGQRAGAAQGGGATAGAAQGRGTAGQAGGGAGAGAQRGGAAGAGAGGAGGRGGAGGGRGGGRGGRAAAFTPEPEARDIKSVLYNWTWHMGMLRSGNENELIKTLHYEAAGGTMQVNGGACTITKYRFDVNYQVPGYRNQIECRRANGQTYKNIEVLSGDFAWDEDIPGAELVPGKGKATPRPEAWRERVIRLWTSPQGAPKAALAGAAGMTPTEAFGQNPATLLDRQTAAGAKPTTTMEWQGAKAVFTYPIPGLTGVTATVTLDKTFLPERVVVKDGATTTEWVYSMFADYNNPLFKIEALYPGNMIERKNGTVVRNVNAKVTEIGQVYIIVPVPDSIQAAGPAPKGN
jgi:hypothetical protein